MAEYKLKELSLYNLCTMRPVKYARFQQPKRPNMQSTQKEVLAYSSVTYKINQKVFLLLFSKQGYTNLDNYFQRLVKIVHFVTSPSQQKDISTPTKFDLEIRNWALLRILICNKFPFICRARVAPFLARCKHCKWLQRCLFLLSENDAQDDMIT